MVSVLDSGEEGPGFKSGNSLRQTVQTCQGPEMKMFETVHHSGEGAIFFAGEHCL